MVSSISPHVGSVEGGNVVVVTGARLTKVTSVEYKAVNDDALGWTQIAQAVGIVYHVSSTKLRIVVPALYAAPRRGVTIYVSVRTSRLTRASCGRRRAALGGRPFVEPSGYIVRILACAVDLGRGRCVSLVRAVGCRAAQKESS